MTVSCQFPVVGRLGGRRCYRAPLLAAPALLLVVCIAATKAGAGEKISFSRSGGLPPPGAIPATLSLLATTPRVLATLIVHASGGLTAGGRLRRGAASRMATLLIDIWTPRGIPSAHCVL
jgi:hypothetical protein